MPVPLADLGDESDLLVADSPLPPVPPPNPPPARLSGGKATVRSLEKAGQRCGYYESRVHRVPFAWRCVVKSGLSVLRFPIRIEWPNCPRCYQPVASPANPGAPRPPDASPPMSKAKAAQRHKPIEPRPPVAIGRVPVDPRVLPP